MRGLAVGALTLLTLTQAQCADTATCGARAPYPVADPATLPAPTLVSVSPAVANNDASTKLTLTGTDFRTGAAVQVGGVDCTEVVVVSPAQITCALPPRVGSCGPQQVVVKNPDLQAAQGRGFNNRSPVLSYAPAVTLSSGQNPDHLLALDLNGDGILDLASSNRKSNDITVRLGNGDGTFSDSVSHLVGQSPIGLAAADLDADGRVDLVSADYNTSTISVLLGDGEGGFPALKAAASGGARVSGVAVGDLNGDGRADVVAVNNNSASVSVLLGDGLGGLLLQGNVVVGATPEEVVLGDLNGDGVLDLVASNYNSNNVSFRPGNGDGTFGVGANLSVGAGSIGLRLRDMDGDAKLDIVVSNGESNSVSVLLNDGAGGFKAALNTAVGTFPYGVLVVDYNSDGVPDLQQRWRPRSAGGQHQRRHGGRAAGPWGRHLHRRRDLPRGQEPGRAGQR